MVQELERRGARVCCTYTGGLDFSVPVQEGVSDRGGGRERKKRRRRSDV